MARRPSSSRLAGWTDSWQHYATPIPRYLLELYEYCSYLNRQIPWTRGNRTVRVVSRFLVVRGFLAWSIVSFHTRTSKAVILVGTTYSTSISGLPTNSSYPMSESLSAWFIRIAERHSRRNQSIKPTNQPVDRSCDRLCLVLPQNSEPLLAGGLAD